MVATRDVGARADLALALADGASASPPCHTDGHAMEPRAERIAPANGIGSLHEDQERGLKGVLGVVSIPHQCATHTEHHRTVAFDQDTKGLMAERVAAGREAFEQLAISQATESTRAQEQFK
jgi:hypothetical protein